MRSRRRHHDDSSLELLLDTVCNAFGGIVFVALLLALLAKTARSTSQSAQSQPERQARQERSDQASDLQHRLDQLRIVERLQTLETDKNKPAKELASRIIEAKTLFNKTQAAYRQQRAAIDERQRTLEGQRERARQDLLTRLAALEKENEEIRSRLAALAREIVGKKREMARMARFPKERRTGKSEFLIALRDGRLYVSPSEFRLVEHPPLAWMEPRPGAGLRMQTAALQASHLRTELAEVPSATNYLAIAVWEDSFDQFDQVRQAVVAMGYEYRLIPLTKDERLYLGNVARPLVQ